VQAGQDFSIFRSGGHFVQQSKRNVPVMCTTRDDIDHSLNTAVYRTPDIARYYEDFHPISRLWTGNEGKFSDDIFQTYGYFICLNEFYISRGIFVALKDVNITVICKID
jgi:hypothetical protein